MLRIALITCALILTCGVTAFDFQMAKCHEKLTDFEVHEWGLYMFYQGIGGDLVSGLGEEDLPDYVFKAEVPHKQDCTCDKCSQVKAKCSVCGGIKGRCQCDVSPRFHKPVINFYTDKEMNVKITAKFENGKHTVWYPKHSSLSSKYDELIWDISLSPKPKNTLKDAKGSSWWDVARDTSSAYVNTKSGESEKFLFYEGESNNLKPAIEIRCKSGKVNLSNKSKTKYTNILVVKDGAIQRLNEFSDKEIDFKETIDVKTATNDLEKMLTKEGLSESEARGVAKIWQKELFERDGIRAIYMMTRQEVDSAIPLQFDPKPKTLKRAMIVCVQDTDSIVSSMINKLGHEDPKIRDAATLVLTRLGKPVKSMLLKALGDTKDAEVKSRLQKIIDDIDKASTSLNSDDKKWVKDGTCSCSFPDCVVMTLMTCQRCSTSCSSMNHTICGNCIRELGICAFCMKRPKK